MFHCIVSLLFLVVFNDITTVTSWNPSNFSFNPGDNYELVWQDIFENVGPVQAIINGQPAYAPNPKNWYHLVGQNSISSGLQNFTDSIQNAYVQNNQLSIVAMKEGYTSAMLSGRDLQQFTFGVFAAKIRLPYGKGMWPAWWIAGNGRKYDIFWPTSGEIDILEMYGGTKMANYTDQFAHGTIHWNNQSNSMNPLFNKYIEKIWETPDGSMLHNNTLVYWTEWNSTTITIGVNEFIYSQINTINLPHSINPSVAFSGVWPFYIYLDLAIIDGPPGPPDNTTTWPQKMVIDWVRVYQQKKTKSEK